jgi:hypothetical protein
MRQRTNQAKPKTYKNESKGLADQTKKKQVTVTVNSNQNSQG